MKELFLSRVLRADELDIVDEEDIALITKVSAEGVHITLAQAGDELVHELLGGHVHDAPGGVLLEDLDADGLEQVCLAEADAAEDEERVVVLAGVVGDGDAGRVGELVGRPDDELIEGVARVDARGLEGLGGGDGLRGAALRAGLWAVEGAG
jgi:hypothetical protein